MDGSVHIHRIVSLCEMSKRKQDDFARSLTKHPCVERWTLTGVAKHNEVLILSEGTSCYLQPLADVEVPGHHDGVRVFTHFCLFMSYKFATARAAHVSWKNSVTPGLLSHPTHLVSSSHEVNLLLCEVHSSLLFSILAVCHVIHWGPLKKK